MNHMTLATRMAYALARDNGLPGSSWLKIVDEKSKNPEHAVSLIFVIEAILCMIPLVSLQAFKTLAQLCTIGLQLSYLIPIGVRLYVMLHPSYSSTQAKSPYSFGKLSLPSHIIAFLWLSVTTILFFLPFQRDPEFGITLANFNYSSAVFGLCFIIGMAYFILAGMYKNFTGPGHHTFKE
jgi:amino acid transporter